MGYPHGCCCCGGCNGWIDSDGSPADGFNCSDCSYSTCQHKCDALNEGDLDNHCCGPPLPETVQFSANTHWAWSWHRAAQTLPCMGTGVPENGAANTVTDGGGSWSCTGEPNSKQVGIWNDSGSAGTGAWWVSAGAINMTLRLDQKAAASANSDDGGALLFHPPGCCAKYYYGKCDLTGPATPSLSDNPWGYDSNYFTEGGAGDVDTVQAPTQLEAFGRLAVLTGGWSHDSDPDLPPRIVMQATLSITVCVKGVCDHFTNLNSTSDHFWAQPLGLVTYSSALVGGCSCGLHLELADKLDWNSPASGSWAYKWEYPGSQQTSGSWSYTDVPGTGCAGTSGYCCGSAPKGGPPWRCSEEDFTIVGYEGSASNSSTQECKKPWAFLESDPANGNRKRNATKVWSYPQTQDTDGGMPTPYFLGNTWPMFYGGSAGPLNDGKGWACIRGTQPAPCVPANSDGSKNTIQMNGGFWGGRKGSGTHTMPMPGLTNVVIGLGKGNLIET